MEMEEGHIQPKISLKRIKFQEMMQNLEEDRISALPDCLLLEILSRLPSTNDAIKTGTLSRRWKNLWTSVPTLIFKYCNHNFPSSDFVSFVDKTLTQCHQLKLKKFEVSSCYDIQFGSQVNNWIRYAIRCNVEQLILTLLTMEAEFFLDQEFFDNKCFTDLRLSAFIFNPVAAISWKNLRSLSICCWNLDEDLIENILTGSPVLETLVLDYCHGYRRLDITSKNVKNLVLNYCYGCRPHDIVEIKAPNILSLTIQGNLVLRKLLLVNVSSLVKANLDYTRENTTPIEEEEEMLEGFIMNLRHVRELKIGVLCSKVLSRLEAKGFVLPSNIKFSYALCKALKLGDA